MLQAFLNWIVPFLFGGIVTGTTVFFKKLNKREKAERNGIQCLLRLELIRQYEIYIKQGYCAVANKDSLKKAYTAYHELGGNDVVSKMYEEIMALPVEEKI